MTIWLDQDGNPAAPPTPTWHAVADAVGAVEAVVILVAGAMTLLVTCVRSRLDRAPRCSVGLWTPILGGRRWDEPVVMPLSAGRSGPAPGVMGMVLDEINRN